jgi:hypothetical protein
MPAEAQLPFPLQFENMMLEAEHHVLSARGRHCR